MCDSRCLPRGRHSPVKVTRYFEVELELADSRDFAALTPKEAGADFS